ncbi:sensor protein ZraS [bacterium BMS3Bbin04]|nr:sensor protein ZraS [bacterium BMS3Bbin04]
MTSSLGRYSELLEKLDDVNQDDSNQEMLHDIESEIRQYGAQIVANASDMIDQERLRVHTWIGSSTIIAVMGLALILLIEVGLATFITRQIIQPFGRFERYTQRIAAGDFSPITPARRYRDEFTNLAIALNRMGKELLEREEQLLQSRKLAAVGTLTAGIAHELNNPLNNISVTTEALIDDLDEFSNDEKLSMLNDINTQTERASHTVANLLDFTHRDTSSFNHLSIKEVLKSAFRLVENEFALNQINLETHFQDNIPKIMGRELNLQQVFVNLFMNAIRAMSEGGTLTVRSRIEDNSVRVDVSDTGVGIAPANLEKIFDPFFTTQDVSKGTGLGLSVSFGIIQRHHGTLSVVSELGEGSTFSVVLPIA